MKPTFKLIEYSNDGGEREIEFKTLSQALLILENSPHYQLIISDEESTGEISIQNLSVSPEIVSFIY